jgi:cation:H+ antiporter
LAENNLLGMIIWLGELTFCSWLLSYGAEHISERYGAKFVGRVLLSIATTLPEIAIVIYAAASGAYGIAIGSGLGSNIMMMTLGLAIMLIISTTRLSKAPLKMIDVSTFKNDKIFLLASAVISLILFLDGYDYVDGIIFIGIFIAYIFIALYEMKLEMKEKALKDNSKEIVNENNPAKDNKKMVIAVGVFLAGALGILIGAGPFIHSMQGFSVEVGISAIVLAVILSPIAGEMPEKISMMILARKGAAGASIAIANVLGSKILNNSLLLAVAIFAAMLQFGFYEKIEITEILFYQIILATLVTIIAVIPMFRRKIGLKFGFMLLFIYIMSILIQFILPQNVEIH